VPPGSPTLLDRLVPQFDATRVEHRVIHAPPTLVYNAVLEADFLDAVRRNSAVRLLFGLRASIERLLGLFRPHRRSGDAAPASLRLIDLSARGEWVRLAEDAPREIVFGAVGRFWAGETKWMHINATEFPVMRDAGYARIGCNFVLRPAGVGATLLSYEARTVATDAASRRGFLRYWRLVAPFVGVVMRAQLGVIARNVSNEMTQRSGAVRVPEHIV
jgi:hypothetical protein